jgi:hypothetical protein
VKIQTAKIEFKQAAKAAENVIKAFRKAAREIGKMAIKLYPTIIKYNIIERMSKRVIEKEADCQVLSKTLERYKNKYMESGDENNR